MALNGCSLSQLITLAKECSLKVKDTKKLCAQATALQEDSKYNDEQVMHVLESTLIAVKETEQLTRQVSEHVWNYIVEKQGDVKLLAAALYKTSTEKQTQFFAILPKNLQDRGALVPPISAFILKNS